MSQLKEFAGRVVNYGRKYGLRAAVGRSWVFVHRVVTGGRMALFFCDLNTVKTSDIAGLGSANVERKMGAAMVDAEDFKKIGSAWNEEITARLHEERFGRGATLWLYKLDGKLAGYGWTMIGGAMEPHFFPLGANDAHLFDFFVFPEFRGRKINPTLVNYILARLAAEGRSRAFIEAAEWNAPQLSSLKRTPFVALGFARKVKFFGKEMIIWSAEAKEKSEQLLAVRAVGEA